MKKDGLSLLHDERTHLIIIVKLNTFFLYEKVLHHFPRPRGKPATLRV